MDIVFMGTPEFAVPCLERLVSDGHNVKGVFTQPDKPKGRGHKMQFPPVKECAVSHGIPVYQPLKMRDGEALGILKELNPELIIVVAYGKILPEEILSFPKHGCVNMHASILPKYRGAAPIQWCVLNGEKESGVTAFFTRSSAANIPINMELCKNLGLDESFYSVSIPLGATINMDGAAITITVMTLAACNTLGIAVDIPSAIFLSFLATLGACGASGVAGGSLLLIPMACSLFGISNDVAMQVVAVGFIISVVQDSCETALNSSGDAMFTATAEYYIRKKTGREMNFLGRWAK